MIALAGRGTSYAETTMLPSRLGCRELTAHHDLPNLGFRSDGRVPHWNVITDLDLSALESITLDDAVTRFRYVIRNLPGVVSSGTGADDRRSGLWQWLPGERSRKRAIYLGSSQTECTYVFRPHACHMLGWLVRVPCC